MRGSNFPGDFFFIRVGGIQITKALRLFGLDDRRRFHDLLRYPSDIGVEVLTPNPVLRKENVHAFGHIKIPKFPFENQPIKTLQNTGDERAKAL